MGATGLAANQDEYRSRLGEQPDAQIDAWAAEAMRDISIRRGVLAVLQDYRSATGADDATVTRIFSAGGGPPAGDRREGPRQASGAPPRSQENGVTPKPASSRWSSATGRPTTLK